MRRIAFLFAGTLLLAACTAGPSASLQDRLQNPLFAEYYYDDLVDQMVTLQLHNDPAVVEDAGKDLADATRRDALQQSRDAQGLQQQGRMGEFVEAEAYAKGEVLLTDDALYFHPTFLATPGVDIRVMLTESIDPRDVEFPDPSAQDLGGLKSPYGDQWYALSAPQDSMRTVVLWDAGLKRLMSFAQLRTH